MSESVNKFRDEYFSNEYLEIYHFFTKEQLETINKLGVKVEDKKYSTYDFDKLESIIIRYYKLRKKLKEISVSNEEYDEILNIFDKISNQYNI